LDRLGEKANEPLSPIECGDSVAARFIQESLGELVNRSRHVSVRFWMPSLIDCPSEQGRLIK